METVERRSLPERIAARLHELILDGTYPAGAQLPHQRDLAQRFGVSTAVVRESLALLGSAGLIWSRSGQGTFVSDRTDATLRYPTWIRSPVNADELAQAIEARDVLERAIVPMAAERRTPDDLARLRAILDEMSAAAREPERYADADLALHLALADAAQNAPLAGALAGLRRLVRATIVLRARHAIDDGTIDGIVVAHRTLVDAVERSDVEAALAEADAMLTRTREAALRHAEAVLVDPPSTV